MKENDLLWESALSTPYQQVHTTFNGETKNMVAFVQLIASNIVKLGKEQKTWLQGP
jgi:tRNA A37 N6-isopentenylltransferase MiaA